MFTSPVSHFRPVLFFALCCLIAVTVTFRSRASKQPLTVGSNGGGPDILRMRGGISNVPRLVKALSPAPGFTRPPGSDTSKVNSILTPAPTLGNYPDVSVPLSADTTIAPDAAPTNTVNIGVFTALNFKGKLEGDPITGNVRVTNAHPAGTYLLTVTAFASGGATTTQTLSLTVTTVAACAPVSFAGATFDAGERVGANFVGDFNGDGKQDLAVAAVATDFSSSRTIILLGDGAGHFSEVSDVPVGVRAVVDFNGDGKQDLIALDSGNAVLYAGDGTGHFTFLNSVATGCTSPFQLAVGDFNGDGKIDLVTACYLVDSVTIMLGDGAGGFGTAASFGVSDGPQGLAVGDFNNDGKQDLAVACMPAGVVSILLGDGAGSFAAPTDFNAGATPRDVEVGDFNGDGKQDLAVSNPSTNTASVMLGNGLGGFGAPASFAVGTDPETVIAVGDFNGDGKQDLAVPNFGSANVSILLGDGAGGFGSATNFAVGLSPFGVVVGDFNGDGMEDLATGNWDSNNTSILLRDCTTASVATPNGANVSVQAGTATVNFANVSTSGTTTFEPIDPSSAGSLPGGFTLCTSCPAYDISTTATYTPPLTICLAVPPSITQQVYSTLKLMHGEDGTLVDRTTAHYADGEGQRWVCGSVNSLSPFALAQGLSPTAAEGEVIGHIVDANGKGIEGVGISMDGGGSRSTITDSEGTYRFDQVQANGFYIVTPARANYSFTPASRSFSSLGFRTEASFTATFNGNQTNAIDASEYFVRQQYLDFLNREPDQNGFAYWITQITQCGGDATCLHNKRVDVSNSFFYELEFQQTGGYVYRLYREAFGNSQPFPNSDALNAVLPETLRAEARKIPGYAVFSQDRARLTGSAHLAQDQLALAKAFVQRPEFLTKYPASLTLEQFVDALLAAINNDDGIDLASQRTALLNLGSRGAVVYRLADDNLQTNPINNRAFIDAEYNSSFVATQYFGYFRRDADIGGFLFWLGQVNSAPLRDVPKQHALVCSQITSAEYQQRFSSVVTHNNTECGP